MFRPFRQSFNLAKQAPSLPKKYTVNTPPTLMSSSPWAIQTRHINGIGRYGRLTDCAGDIKSRKTLLKESYGNMYRIPLAARTFLDKNFPLGAQILIDHIDTFKGTPKIMAKALDQFLYFEEGKNRGRIPKSELITLTKELISHIEEYNTEHLNPRHRDVNFTRYRDMLKILNEQSDC